MSDKYFFFCEIDKREACLTARSARTEKLRACTVTPIIPSSAQHPNNVSKKDTTHHQEDCMQLTEILSKQESYRGMLPKVVKNSFPPTTLGPAVRLKWSPRVSAVSLPSKDCFRLSRDAFLRSVEFLLTRTGLIMPVISPSLQVKLGVRFFESPAIEGLRDEALEDVLANDRNASFFDEMLQESNLRVTLIQQR